MKNTPQNKLILKNTSGHNLYQVYIYTDTDDDWCNTGLSFNVATKNVIETIDDDDEHILITNSNKVPKEVIELITKIDTIDEYLEDLTECSDKVYITIKPFEEPEFILL